MAAVVYEDIRTTEVSMFQPLLVQIGKPLKNLVIIGAVIKSSRSRRRETRCNKENGM
ncbi:hypothetical protein MAJ_06784, partial [Metarhizium majus ARSEF 297]